MEEQQDMPTMKINEQLENEDLCEVIDGINWMPEWGIENLRFALSYQARPDDLFIVTYPRSGTTWMQNIVYNLLSNGKPFDEDTELFFRQNPTLELEGEAGIELMKRPAAIKTHLPLDRVPYHPQAKYICVVRNPKDVCISYYIFYNMWGDVPKLDFDRFFQYFIEGRLPFGNYFDVLQSAWKRKNDSNVLFIRYEQMKTDFRSVIDKIAKFINIPLTPDLIERVLKYSSFDYMKSKYDSERRASEEKYIEKIENTEVQVQRREIFLRESGIQVVRKGLINEWKQSMTKEQSDIIYKRFMEICQDSEDLEDCWSQWNVF